MTKPDCYNQKAGGNVRAERDCDHCPEDRDCLPVGVLPSKPTPRTIHTGLVHNTLKMIDALTKQAQLAEKMADASWRRRDEARAFLYANMKGDKAAVMDIGKALSGNLVRNGAYYPNVSTHALILQEKVARAWAIENPESKENDHVEMP